MERESYTVTEKAGAYVAGRRVGAGETIVLTEQEARYELLSEAIEPASKAVPKQPAKAKTPPPSRDD